MLFSKNKKIKTEEVDATPKIKKPKKNRHVGIWIILTVLTISSGFGLYNLFFKEATAEILTSFTKYDSVTMSISGSGTTLPKNLQAVTVASRAEILEVYVAQGDTVQVGDVLYRQDDSDVDDLIEDYKDQITEQQEKIDEYEDAVDDYNEQLEEANENLQKLTIYAPFSGHLTSVSVEEGDDVQNGTRLAVINQDGKMKLTQYFSYVYEKQINLGMSAKVSVPTLMNVYDGTVTDIKKVEYITNEGVKCFAVTITVNNPGAFTQGMEAEGYIITSNGTEIFASKSGTFQYNNTENIKSEVSGTLTNWDCVDYQYVEAGTALGTIDSDTYEEQISNVKKMIERNKGYIVTCNERIETLRQNIEDAEESRENYEVCAEIDGMIIACTIEKGDKPMTNQTAILLYNLDVMTVAVTFDEYDVDYVKKGMEVDVVRTGANGNTTYKGTISELSLEGTSSGSVSYFDATIEISSGGKLASGVSVAYYITVGEEEEGVLVPIAALQNTSEGYCVFVKSQTRPANAIDIEDAEIPNGFYAVPIEVGTSTSQYVKAISGIEKDVEVFVGYKQEEPSGGKSKSDNLPEDSETSESSNSFGGNMSGGMMPGDGSFTPGGGMRGDR